MSTIPFGAARCDSNALHDEPIGFLALLGLVGLSGVVVNDSLVLVSHINGLAAPHRHPDHSPPLRRDLRAAPSHCAHHRDHGRRPDSTGLWLGRVGSLYGTDGPRDGLWSSFGDPANACLVPCLYTITIDLESLISRFRHKRLPHCPTNESSVQVAPAQAA